MSDQINQDHPAEIDPELRQQAVERTLYHYPGVTPTMVTMVLGKRFTEAPPLPTENEKEQATEIVKKFLKNFETSMQEAVFEVTRDGFDE